MHICRYYHDDDYLPTEVRSELEDAVYGAFFSGDRGSVPSAPSPVRDTLNRLTRTATFTRYTEANERLSDRFAHEAIHWVSERWGELEEHDPFEEEEATVERAFRHGDGAPSDEQVRLDRKSVV